MNWFRKKKNPPPHVETKINPYLVLARELEQRYKGQDIPITEFSDWQKALTGNEYLDGFDGFKTDVKRIGGVCCSDNMAFYNYKGYYHARYSLGENDPDILFITYDSLERADPYIHVSRNGMSFGIFNSFDELYKGINNNTLLRYALYGWDNEKEDADIDVELD